MSGYSQVMEFLSKIVPSKESNGGGSLVVHNSHRFIAVLDLTDVKNAIDSNNEDNKGKTL